MKEQGIKEYTRILKMIHFFVMSSLFLFGMVVLLFSEGGNETLEKTSRYDMLVPLAVIIGVGLGYLLFTLRVKRSLEMKELSEKLGAYRSAILMRLVLMEAPGLLAIFAFRETGDYFFLSLAGLVFLILFTIRFRQAKMMDELGLSEEERNKINQVRIKI